MTVLQRPDAEPPGSVAKGQVSHVIHGSLIRPILFAGAEPSVVIVESCITFALLFVVGLHLLTIGLALFWTIGVHSVMASVAKGEPQMTSLYIRSLAGRDFYAPLAGARTPVRGPSPSIPGHP